MIIRPGMHYMRSGFFLCNKKFFWLPITQKSKAINSNNDCKVVEMERKNVQRRDIEPNE